MGHPRLAVVVPAGPADDVEDTIASVLHFVAPPRLVVVVDDTGRDMAARLTAMSPDVDVIAPPLTRPGLAGGLWVKIASGYRRALERFEFDALLRLDADALLIGPGLADRAVQRFRDEPQVGLLGSNRFGMDGGTRDWSWPASMLTAECGLPGFGRPALRRQLRALRTEALEHGYTPGEHALGGAYIHSGDAVRTLAARSWLELQVLEQSRLGEDHLFALLTRAAGYQIGEFAGPDDPMALDWKRLPAAPAALLARGKLVTHSVRAWGECSESEIRAFFRDARRSLPPE